MKTPTLEYVEQNIHKMVPRVLRSHYPDFFEYLNSHWPDLRTSEQLYRYFYGEPQLCYCGSITKYINFSKGYSKYCSCSCAAKANQSEREQTNMRLYGAPTNFVRPDVRSKILSKTEEASTTRKRTCLERYGVENASQTTSSKESYKRTCLERYGVVNTFQSDQIKQKIKSTCLERYGVENPSQCAAIQKRAAKNRTEPCTWLLPIGGSNQNNSIELFIKDILTECGIVVPEHHEDRTILNGRGLDFYIPEKQLAIECNGIYWHSSTRHPKDYHYKKFIDCQTHDIQLLSIWQDWIINKPEIVRSMIRNKLGCSTRIFARKCKIVKLHNITQFLNENHIQGACKSSVKLGLVHNGEIVSVMVFNKRSALSGSKNINNSEWELIRFCNRLNTTVVGGASKLLKYFILHYSELTGFNNLNKIVSFSSNDISDGSLYKTLGFKKKSSHIPYWYIENSTLYRYHRSSFTRASIVRRWPEYDINDRSWTEKSVMDNKPFHRIYDSGMTRWELIIETMTI